jgi:hypothetical protein
MTLDGWSSHTGIKYATLYMRIKSGMSIEKAISLPLQGKITAEVIEKVKELRASGRGGKSVAIELGIDEKTVYRISPGTVSGMVAATPGEKRGLLTLVEEVLTNNRFRMVLCRCECGGSKIVRLYGFLSGAYHSCGCVHHSQIHGYSRQNNIHYLYGILSGMKARCYRRSHVGYRNYGAKGVRISQEWLASPVAFIEYVLFELGGRPSAAHTIDRINTYGNYEPGNIRWATPLEQANNKRTREVA